MGGPTLLAHGTEEQKKRFLPPMVRGEEIWCQLFSEPGAGSDVAGLSTKAERDGEEWILNGQKVWTTLAHISAFGLLVTRTNPDVPKHRGMTAFLVDMHAPGVEVRPLFQITGEAEFNEVFFTDVRAPESARIGAEGDGWRVAVTTVMNERVSIGGAVHPRGEGPIAAALSTWAKRVDHDPVRRDQLAKLWVEAEVLRLGNIRAQGLRERGVPGPEGSVLKLGGALLMQRIADFVVDLEGPEGMLCSGYGPGASDRSEDPVINLLAAQSSTIAGGTSEIMRNILGERVLGLPREPGLDPNLPWSQIPRSA
jgi:alkylation response protein AidB-like acyl-CoA dehydrogenase